MQKIEKLLVAGLIVLFPTLLALILVSIQLHNRPTIARTSTFPPVAGDSTQISSFQNVLECIGGTTSKPCLDNFVLNYVGDKSVRELLADLEINRTKNTTIENNCHPIAHAIGRYAYQSYGNVGDAFMACDQSCHSGCYHGVMERLFYTPEQLANNVSHLTFADMETKVPDICSEDKFTNPTRAIIFQCLHGVGHAILFSLNYNLEDSLRSCDLLPTDYDRQSCYGGVVMENITAFEREKRDMKMDDPHYPCNKLAEKYQYTCYLMQTSIMTEQGLSNARIAEECRKTNESNRSACFTSLGRDLSNSVRTGRSDIVVNVCENISADNALYCINGTIYALIDNTWDTSFAFPFCSQFASETNRRQCFLASGSYAKNVYTFTRTELLTACEQYAGNEVSLCKEVMPMH